MIVTALHFPSRHIFCHCNRILCQSNEKFYHSLYFIVCGTESLLSAPESPPMERKDTFCWQWKDLLIIFEAKLTRRYSDKIFLRFLMWVLVIVTPLVLTISQISVRTPYQYWHHISTDTISACHNPKLWSLFRYWSCPVSTLTTIPVIQYTHYYTSQSVSQYTHRYTSQYTLTIPSLSTFTSSSALYGAL